ncbi:MAG: hypothetical protein JWM98_1007, partial [Thermoleophilia bacterium]|nr:hypothetical protein [Thermoleophilia bacterium]
MPQHFQPAGPRLSFAEQIAQARNFFNGGAQPAAAAAPAGAAAEAFGAADVPAGAVAAAEPAAAEAGAQFVPEAAGAAAGVAGHDPEALARAAQAAAQGGLNDPAFMDAARPQIQVHVQPRLIMQQAEQVNIPVDIAVPGAQAQVFFAQPNAVLVDRAGNLVPQAAQAVPGGAAAAAAAAPVAAAAPAAA